MQVSPTWIRGNMDLLEGRKALQRDLDRLNQLDEASRMRFSGAKCQVLHLDHNSLREHAGLGKSGCKVAWQKSTRECWSTAAEHKPECGQVAKKPVASWPVPAIVWPATAG